MAAHTSRAVLIERFAPDGTCLTADHLNAGGHQPRSLIELSSRFSRRPAGINAIANAVANGRLGRIVYLEKPSQ